MTVRRCAWEPDEIAAEPEWREAWIAWLRRHGIDPEDVCVPGWVEADDDARTIRFEAYARDDAGKTILRPHKLALERVVRVVQLEAPALPFPGASP